MDESTESTEKIRNALKLLIKHSSGVKDISPVHKTPVFVNWEVAAVNSTSPLTDLMSSDNPVGISLMIYFTSATSSDS